MYAHRNNIEDALGEDKSVSDIMGQLGNAIYHVYVDF